MDSRPPTVHERIRDHGALVPVDIASKLNLTAPKVNFTDSACPSLTNPLFQYDPRLPVVYPWPKYLYLQKYPLSLGNPLAFPNTPPLEIDFQGLAANKIGVEEIHFAIPENQAPSDWDLFFDADLPGSPGIGGHKWLTPARQ